MFLNSTNTGDYIKLTNLHLLVLNFCSRKQKYLEKWKTFIFSMYSVNLCGINSCPMCTKTMFSKFSDIRNYIKLLNSHILELNFCSRKSKYMEKWNTFWSSMYSVVLRGINLSPMCIKKMFLNFPKKEITYRKHICNQQICCFPGYKKHIFEPPQYRSSYIIRKFARSISNVLL